LAVTVKSLEVYLILSVLVPMSLLSGFKLAGIIGGPVSVAETLQLQPAVWNRVRTFDWSVVPDPWFNASYVGSDVALTVTYCFARFDENPSWGGPTLSLGIKVLNLSVTTGFVSGVDVAFQESYALSRAVYATPSFSTYGNLTCNEMVDGNSGFRPLGEDKLHAQMLAVGEPSSVYVADFYVNYQLNSPHSQAHQIMIEATVTYFNGTVYKQLIQPLKFNFAPNHNHSFDEAYEISFGTRRDCLDGNINGDQVEYFKIPFTEGQKVKVAIAYLQHEPWLFSDIYIYNPNRELEASLLVNLNDPPYVTFSINQTGWWYIKIAYVDPVYNYILDISQVSG
jgi:hypothetical protein